MAPLPPVRKRTSYADVGGADLVFALFYPKLLDVGAMQPEAEGLDPVDAELAAARAIDLERWARKAIKALEAGRPAAVKFTPDALDEWEAGAIERRLEGATTVDEVRAAFKAEPGEKLSPDERALYDQLLRKLTAAQRATLDAVIAGEPVDPDLIRQILPDLVSALAAAAEQSAASAAASVGTALDPLTVATAAGRWAQAYAGELIVGIDDATRKYVGQAVSYFLETPGVTRQQLETRLRAAFSAARAEAIAITEITRAASAGTNIAREQLAAAGFEYVRVWRTSADDRTCPICGPLGGVREDRGWADRFPGGPPAHVRCRCSTTLERRS